MLEAVIIVIAGAGLGAFHETVGPNTGSTEQPCEVQVPVVSELDPGKVLYYKCVQ